MSACRKCGLPLVFVKREYGGVLKLTPVNPDGTDHWPTCRENKLPPKPVGAAPECNCPNPTPQLRRCSANSAVCWQCSSCERKLSKWLPRSELGGVDVSTLPEYAR
jgi:hypothetical protein